jgi:hypothetical protein
LQGDDHLDFVVNVAGFDGVGEVLAAAEQVVRIFLEKEWILALRVMTHFDRVCGIITADTINPAHRKALLRAADRQAGLRRRLENVVAHLISSNNIFARRFLSARMQHKPSPPVRRQRLRLWQFLPDN